MIYTTRASRIHPFFLTFDFDTFTNVIYNTLGAFPGIPSVRNEAKTLPNGNQHFTTNKNAERVRRCCQHDRGWLQTGANIVPNDDQNDAKIDPESSENPNVDLRVEKIFSDGFWMRFGTPFRSNFRTQTKFSKIDGCFEAAWRMYFLILIFFFRP